MKKQSLLIALLLLIIVGGTTAQVLEHKNYDWKPEPKLHKLNSQESSLEELVLKEKQSVEFIYEGNGELTEYKLYHKIVRVNSNTAIESHNKIYVPNLQSGTFITHKARVINLKGKVRELSEKDIKEAVDEETRVTYRYFALEGLEMGSEIEHLYYIKKFPRYTGSREVIQSAVKKKNVEFDLISPQNLHFKVKSYNGFPELKKDTATTQKNRLFVSLDSLQGLKEELMAAYRANLQYIVYKLDANTASNKKDLISYGHISENIYKLLMRPEEGNVEKKIKKLLGQIDTKFAQDEEDKVKIIEQYLKTNFTQIQNDRKGLNDLEVILDKKVANEEGIVKLFAAVLRQANVPYQIVLTCERDEMKFDPDFEAYVFLNNYLIYLPSLNKYLEPNNRISVVGYINFNLTNNYGLFIKEVSLGEYGTGIGEVKFIDPLAYDKSYDNINVKVDFNEEVIHPKITIERQMSGYYAQYFQPFYSYYTPEDRTKVNSMIMKDFITNVEIKDIAVENEGKDFFGKKPFIVKSSLTDETLVQKAGEKYLFKVGEMIGRQMEMYQKEERKLAVENDYNRLYRRSISFNIPKGYKIVNPEVLEMDVFMEEKGERITTFTSKSIIKDGVCTINVDEYYKKISFSNSEFEDFRKVINAAADFNKITIILQKI